VAAMISKQQRVHELTGMPGGRFLKTKGIGEQAEKVSVELRGGKT
jgi:hypothetical protein